MNKRVLIINGFALDESVWNPLKDKFSEYNVNIHSHNKSVTIKKLKEHTFEFISKFKEEELIIITWSLGALLILDLSSKLSDFNYDLVIINGTSDFCNKDFGIDKSIVDSMILGLDKSLDKTMKSFIKKCSRSIKYNGNYPELEVLKTQLRYLKTTKIYEMSFKKNPLIIHGSCDRICSLRAGEFLHKSIVNSELIIIDGGNHLMFYHEYTKIFEIIKERCL